MKKLRFFIIAMMLYLVFPIISVNALDIPNVSSFDLNAKATITLSSDETMREIEFSIDESDIDNITITATPADTQFSVTDIALLDEKIHVEGNFSVQDNTLYTITLNKMIIVDGEEIPIYLSILTNLQNDTPIDLASTNCIQLKNTLQGIIPNEPVPLSYTLTKNNGDVYCNNIMVTIPAEHSNCQIVFFNIPVGKYSISYDTFTDDYTINEMTLESKVFELTSDNDHLSLNTTLSFRAKCVHVEIITPEILATCISSGMTMSVYCDVCEKVLVSSEKIPALEHDMKFCSAVEATCLESGLTSGKKCTRCDYFLGLKIVPPKGHSPAAIKSKAPTCTEKGLTEGKMCSRCYFIMEEQKTIPTINHKLFFEAGSSPTCTTAGYTDGIGCINCDYSEGHKLIAPLGHVVIIDKAIAATSIMDGKTEGTHCGRCEFIIRPQNTIQYVSSEIISP